MGANRHRNEVPRISSRVAEKVNPFLGHYRQASAYSLPVTSPEAIYLPQICIEDLVYATGDTFPFGYTEGVRNPINVLVTEEGLLKAMTSVRSPSSSPMVWSAPKLFSKKHPGGRLL